MKTLLLGCIFALFVDAASAQVVSGQSLEKLKQDTTTHHFVQEATMANLKEIEGGRLAQLRAKDQAVKDFGKRMVSDHTRASDELRQILKSKQINIPQPNLPADPASIALRNSTGSAFDKLYIKQMLKDHEKTLTLFEKAATDVEDETLKRFAEKMIPTLKEHHTAAVDIAAKLGISKKTGGQKLFESF